MSGKKIKVLLVTITLIFVGFLLWNSALLSVYRATSIANDYHFCCDDEYYYENLELVDVNKIDGIEFYLFEMDEYNGSEELIARIYIVVRRDKNFLGMSTYIQFVIEHEPNREGHVYGKSWYQIDYSEFVLVGVKDVNDYNKVTLVLKDGNEIVVDVTDTKLMFYYASEGLEVEDVIPVR